MWLCARVGYILSSKLTNITWQTSEIIALHSFFPSHIFSKKNILDSEQTMKVLFSLTFRVYFLEITVKIPSQKTHLGNLSCDFPEKYSTIYSLTLLQL